jgi:hypothetical protein
LRQVDDVTRQRENTRPEISSEEIRSQVAEAAYYRALQRGFTPGKELEDWLHAEAQIMTRLGAGVERNYINSGTKVALPPAWQGTNSMTGATPV